MGNILVLGATSGIAKELCYTMANDGKNLIIAGRNLSELERMATDLSIRFGVRVTPTRYDAEKTDLHRSFFNECVALGDLDGVVLAYGYMTEQKQTESEFYDAKRVIELNFLTCVSILHIAADYLIERKQGFVCAISSVAGDRGRQSNYTYGSAKAGLTAFLQGLRNRLNPYGVHVLTVKPGFVDTKMTYGTLKDSPLVAKPGKVAVDIYRAIRKKKDVIYTPFFWSWIMLIIRVIPEKIFKRLKL